MNGFKAIFFLKAIIYFLLLVGALTLYPHGDVFFSSFIQLLSFCTYCLIATVCFVNPALLLKTS